MAPATKMVIQDGNPSWGANPSFRRYAARTRMAIRLTRGSASDLAAAPDAPIIFLNQSIIRPNPAGNTLPKYHAYIFDVPDTIAVAVY
jgi:hypothetical protein